MQSSLMRFLKYIKPYWFLILLSTIGGFIRFAVPMIFPKVFQYLIDNVLLVQGINVAQKYHTVGIIMISLVAIYLIVWAPATYFRRYLSGLAGQRLILDLRTDLYEHVMSLSNSYFKRNQSGAIVSRVINDVALAQNMVGNALTNLWMSVLSLIVVIGIMLSMDWKMTLIAMVAFPAYFYVQKNMRTKARITSRQIQRDTAEMAGEISERLTAMDLIKVFTGEKFELHMFFKKARKLYKSTVDNTKVSAFVQMMSGLLTSIGPVIVVWYGSSRVLSGTLTVGAMTAFYMYLGQLYQPIAQLSDLDIVVANSLAAIDRIFELFDEQPEIKDKENAVVLKRVNGLIEYDNVSFAYEGSDKILKHINITIQPGQRVALVGHSGAGKSTFVSLLPRFYDVTEGAIRVDGYDIRDVTLKSLRQQIGMVMQDTVLFNGTIYDNILYGNPRASKRDVKAAAKAADAHGFIKSLPNGYYTEVGERGAKLSGGQKQRIAIARAFLKNPPILILDEATSALDSQAENLIQNALNRLMKGRTTIIIAHRLSTIMDADIIVVLENGEIVESGTHSELLKRQGIYYSLYNEQYNKKNVLVG
ncbi:ABC transporter ATP-binding protein [Mahella australiensis]|uniref:ABC transporter related protein n=1 Tax=Mahella australiensis (strain DSM 15567 / CIP 107919 / 50-1 BON) TaxID=697281 RepID=F3ZWQ1_MAHA5|nr:ABC transporter ATP-binding protein [Mahella australiensis]AEE96494.1 ABC transporter related protein [Mahella australiensis 50-1 BON]